MNGTLWGAPASAPASLATSSSWCVQAAGRGSDHHVFSNFGWSVGQDLPSVSKHQFVTDGATWAVQRDLMSVTCGSHWADRSDVENLWKIFKKREDFSLCTAPAAWPSKLLPPRTQGASRPDGLSAFFQWHCGLNQPPSLNDLFLVTSDPLQSLYGWQSVGDSSRVWHSCFDNHNYLNRWWLYAEGSHDVLGHSGENQISRTQSYCCSLHRCPHANNNTHHLVLPNHTGCNCGSKVYFYSSSHS